MINLYKYSESLCKTFNFLVGSEHELILFYHKNKNHLANEMTNYYVDKIRMIRSEIQEK